MKIISIDNTNLHLLQNFIDNLGDTAQNFRYFNHRNIDVIKNHLLTVLLVEKDKPVAYGHLDVENDIVWLGACVLPDFQGQGLSNMVMNELINFARKNKVKEIHLTVDNDNTNAVYLYKKFGFKRKKELKTYSEYVLNY
jgi:ribosomal protein S18 acetylase RimI-like enzyme